MWACGGKQGTSPTPVSPSQTAATLYSLSGTVRADHAALPIGGATVSITDGATAGKTATTDASGSFKITDVASGSVNVKVTATNYLVHTEQVVLTGNAQVTFTLAVDPAITGGAPPAGTPLVQALYIVPTNKTEDPTYADYIARALRGLQTFYKSALGSGKTFALTTPVVQTRHSSHDAAWFQGSGGVADLYFRGLEDARALIGSPDVTLVIYVDADQRCGQYGGSGALGATVLPANDLRGLSSKPLVKICPTDSTVDVGYCRWVGGLGHELGHAFGLPHPDGCDANLPTCPASALMAFGYITYPAAQFTDADKTKLNQSRFFVPGNPPWPVCY